jgi:hypothetical protein
MTARRSVVFVALGLSAVLMPAAAARSAPIAGHSENVTMHVLPLTGSSQALIYGEYDPRGDEHGLPVLEGVVLRQLDGSEQRLSYDAAGEGSLEHWSMAKTTVTALEQPATLDVESPVTVVWWDVAAGTTGQLSLPTSLGYVGAAPGGVLYLSKSGHVHFMDYSGASAKWAKVVPSRPTHISVNAVSSGRGVVIGFAESGLVGKHALYIAFAHPGKAVSLKFPDYGRCWSLTRKYAGCLIRHHDYHSSLVPLDGSKPIAGSLHHEYKGRVAIAGQKTLVWTYYKVREPAAGIGCRTAGRPKRHFGEGFVGAELVRGLGTAVTATEDLSRLEIVTTCPDREELPAPLPLP